MKKRNKIYIYRPTTSFKFGPNKFMHDFVGNLRAFLPNIFVEIVHYKSSTGLERKLNLKPKK